MTVLLTSFKLKAYAFYGVFTILTISFNLNGINAFSNKSIMSYCRLYLSDCELLNYLTLILLASDDKILGNSNLKASVIRKSSYPNALTYWKRRLIKLRHYSTITMFAVLLMSLTNNYSMVLRLFGSINVYIFWDFMFRSGIKLMIQQMTDTAFFLRPFYFLSGFPYYFCDFSLRNDITFLQRDKILENEYSCR